MPHSIFHGRWSWHKVSQTPITNIWPSIALVVFWTWLVWAIEEAGTFTIQLPAAFLSGTVGTILAFCIGTLTGSACGSYNEGRRLWTTIQTVSTELAQNIWFNISDKCDDEGQAVPRNVIIDDAMRQRMLESKLTKKSMINLIQAYAVALKHNLRGEPGAFYSDLYPLIAWLPHFAGASHLQASEIDWMPIWATSRELHCHDGQRPPMLTRGGTNLSRPSLVPARARGVDSIDEEKTAHMNTFLNRSRNEVDIEAVLPTIASEVPLLPAQSQSKTRWSDHIPILLLFKWLYRRAKRHGPSANDIQREQERNLRYTPSNVPLEILNHLLQYWDICQGAGRIRPGCDGQITADISNLLSVGNNLRRIRCTPLPFAYQAHLRIATWLYFIFFPLTMHETLGWTMVLAAAVMSYIYFGLLFIASELTNPFGYDRNDLDMEGFCANIRHELAQITAHEPNTTAMPYVFSSNNKPFAPADPRTAKEIVQAGDYAALPNGPHQLQRTLLCNWRAVEANLHAHIYARKEKGDVCV